MKKTLTFCAFFSLSLLMYGQFNGSMNYMASFPQQDMAKNIDAVHQIVLVGGYRLPNAFKQLSIGAELGYGTYANLRVPVTLSFDNSPPTSTHINYASNTFNAHAFVNYDLTRHTLLTPYVSIKGGFHNFHSNIRVDDPEDTDGCQPLERKSILRDNTTSFSYGGGFRYQLKRHTDAKFNRKQFIDFQITQTRGGTIDYINTKKLEDHAHHTATLTSTDVAKPLEIRFINVQSNVVHNHMVAEVFSTPLRLLSFKFGYYMEF
jgi:hypothetical protein